MPAQVVVVRRSRRSLFAAPRALPNWLRAVGAAFSRKPLGSGPETRPAFGSAMDAVRFPGLVRDAAGDHRCTACGACVRVCPSRCLELDTGDGEGAASILRFELNAGACIGCRLCVEGCPEEALDLALEGPFASGSRGSRRSNRDLLGVSE